MSPTDDMHSSPCKSPAPVASRENKRRRTATPDQPSSPVPGQTSRTAARCGVSNADMSTITKRATNFKDLICVILNMIAWGIDPEFADAEVGNQFVKVFQETPKKIYSGLNDADYAAMIQANGIHNGGRIMIREPMIKVPESFYDQANKYFRRISLTKAAGCRHIIGLFLVNAIELADQQERCELTLFEEQPIQHDNLLGIGPISGPVDFLVSRALECIGLRKVPGLPYLAVVETKSVAKYGMISFLAQLCAQMLTLHELDGTKSSQVGALTDGIRWNIFLSVREGSGFVLYETGDMVAQDREGLNRIIGLIVYFLMGNVPDFNPEDNVYLQQKSLNTDMY